MLALLLAGPEALASPEPELSSTKTIFALSLVQAADAKEALEIRGASIGTDPTRFSAVATLPQVPCPGLYKDEAQTENQRTGALSAYSAVVTLTPLPPDRSLPCGDVPPPRPGTLGVSVSNEREPIDLVQANRSGSRGFFGELTTTSQPECDERYTLSIDVDLRGWSRSIRYRLKVLSWRSEAHGLPLENHPSC